MQKKIRSPGPHGCRADRGRPARFGPTRPGRVRTACRVAMDRPPPTVQSTFPPLPPLFSARRGRTRNLRVAPSPARHPGRTDPTLHALHAFSAAVCGRDGWRRSLGVILLDVSPPPSLWGRLALRGEPNALNATHGRARHRGAEPAPPGDHRDTIGTSPLWHVLEHLGC
jgi:hypothetical protein